MRRLIYDMYYADEISVEIAERLLERLEKVRNKRRKILNEENNICRYGRCYS